MQSTGAMRHQQEEENGEILIQIDSTKAGI
jgi:hypothetical protein